MPAKTNESLSDDHMPIESCGGKSACVRAAGRAAVVHRADSWRDVDGDGGRQEQQRQRGAEEEHRLDSDHGGRTHA